MRRSCDSQPQRIGNVTTDAMARLVKALRDKKRSENTIKGYLAHLCSSLSWAATSATRNAADSDGADAARIDRHHDAVIRWQKCKSDSSILRDTERHAMGDLLGDPAKK